MCTTQAETKVALEELDKQKAIGKRTDDNIAENRKRNKKLESQEQSNLNKSLYFYISTCLYEYKIYVYVCQFNI